MTRPTVDLHFVFCVVAIILGVAIFFNGIHVQPHEATGLILATLGVLLLV